MHLSVFDHLSQKQAYLANRTGYPQFFVIFWDPLVLGLRSIKFRCCKISLRPTLGCKVLTTLGLEGLSMLLVFHPLNHKVSNSLFYHL